MIRVVLLVATIIFLSCPAFAYHIEYNWCPAGYPNGKNAHWDSTEYLLWTDGSTSILNSGNYHTENSTFSFKIVADIGDSTDAKISLMALHNYYVEISSNLFNLSNIPDYTYSINYPTLTNELINSLSLNTTYSYSWSLSTEHAYPIITGSASLLNPTKYGSATIWIYQWWSTNFQITSVAIPEPSSLCLLFFGLILFIKRIQHH